MRINLDSKFMIVVPLALTLFAILVLLNNYSSHGYFLEKNIDLKGGVQLTIESSRQISTREFESFLKQKLHTADIRVRTSSDPVSGEQKTIIIEAGVQNETTLEEYAGKFLDIELTDENRSITKFGSTLASAFWDQAQKAFFWAFLFMTFIIFLSFRRVDVSLVIVSCILLDILATIGIISFLGVKLSLASFAALLMILGYGVDSNVILTNRVIKEKYGSVGERIAHARKTGLTMTGTTIVALMSLYFLAMASALKTVAMVLLIGLISDLIYTWIMNANILKLIVGRK